MALTLLHFTFRMVKMCIIWVFEMEKKSNDDPQHPGESSPVALQSGAPPTPPSPDTSRRSTYEGFPPPCTCKAWDCSLMPSTPPSMPRRLSASIHLLRLWCSCWGTQHGDLRMCEYCGEDADEILVHFMLTCPSTDRLRTLLGASSHSTPRDHTRALS